MNDNLTLYSFKLVVVYNLSSYKLFFQTYKPPMYQDIPEELNVTLYEGDRNSNQERGVLGSKATGEPATHMGISVAFAIRNAINAMKKEMDSEGSKWYSLGKSYESHDGVC